MDSKADADADTSAPTIDTSSEHLTSPGAAVGTIAYMSPEQVRAKELDARTDLFSFGAVLYEMTTGTLPFRGESTGLVFDAILNREPVPAARLNPGLPLKLDEIISKCLEKDRNLRYQHAADVRTDLHRLKRGTDSNQSAATQARSVAPRRSPWMLIAAVVVVAALAAGGYLAWHRPGTKLTDRDTIVLADFANSTGDAVFDDTLKTALSVSLRQSPFLNVLPDGEVTKTLQLMSRPADSKLTPEVARELCLRAGSKLYLAGAIASLGSEYVLGLKALNCQSGEPLAEEQVTAASKEKVLDAMGAAASKLRAQLGESLATIKAFDVPLEQASTPSLDALKAYSLGRKMEAAKGGTAALPLYQRAVELDPNFAMAYQELAVTYSSLSQLERGAQNARRAYDLRAKVSDRERFSIEGYYYTYATGEREKAAQSYELWQQAYPRDSVPYRNLGNVSNDLGNLEKALEEYREALRLDPSAIWNYGNLASAYMNLNRLDEAEAVFRQAEERKLSGYLLVLRRKLAFLKGDEARLVQLAAAAAGEPGVEDQMLGAQANCAAWYGKMKDADDLTRRAMDSALHYDAQETAGGYQVDAAVRTAEMGKSELVRRQAAAAVKLAPKSNLRIWAALALVRAGDPAPAEKLIDELDKEFPQDTFVQGSYLPTLRAAVALEHKDPNHAIDLLKRAGRFDVGGGAGLYQIYLRGEAYIASHDGKAAAAEFQKFVDHRGLVGSDPLGALARLGLARADALQGNSANAKTEYQDFLTLWKDADLDIPVLKEAKAEYAKLQ